MDPSTDLSQYEQSPLQNILGGSTPSLIPESLVTTLTIGFIVLNVLGILFFVFYVASIIRKWKVESAVLHMQKDLADIKTALSAQSHPVAPPTPATTPAGNNPVIASHELPDSDQTPRNLS